MNKKLFHALERECLIYLSKKEATLELLRPLINEFLSTQPEHLLLILTKEGGLGSKLPFYAVAYYANNQPLRYLSKIFLLNAQFIFD